MILAITLLLLYSASAWVMLRSVSNPRLDPIAWVITLGAIFAHSDAIVHMMRSVGPFSIGLLEAVSLLAWTLSVLACLIAIERQNRVLAAILLFSAAIGAMATGTRHTYAEETAPGWELTAHILLSMGAAALLFAAAVTAILLVFLDRRLRTRRLADLPTVLPPLDALETVMFRLIGAGFVLLSLALLTGLIFVTDLWAQHLQHKTILSRHRLGDLRCAPARPHPLRVARARRGALDVERFRFSGTVVFRIEIRARIPARTTLGLTAETNDAFLPRCSVQRIGDATAPRRLLRRQ